MVEEVAAAPVVAKVVHVDAVDSLYSTRKPVTPAVSTGRVQVAESRSALPVETVPVFVTESERTASGSVRVPAVFTPWRPCLRTRKLSTRRISAAVSSRENTSTSATFQSLISVAT